MGWLNDWAKSILNPGASQKVQANDANRAAMNTATTHPVIHAENLPEGPSGGSVLQLGGMNLIGEGTQQAISNGGYQFAQNLLNRAQIQYGVSDENGGGGMGAAAGATGVIGSDGTYNTGSGQYGGQVGTQQVKSTMSKAERDKLYKMKDSNVPYYYDHDENDLMYLAASEKKDYMWGLKEEVFLYTMHDRKKHKYITGFNIDSDADNICTSCQIDMPYKPELMEYYIPGKTVFMIIGGTFDREVLFVGRVSEINQLGDSIQVIGQNVGWKFKQYMSDKFYQKIQGLPVPLVVKAIFKELGFTEGKYHMDLWAIPNVFKYKLDESCTIKYKGEQVQNVPELEDVVKRMKEADINAYVATRAKVRTTQENASDYSKKAQQKLTAVTLSSISGKSSSYRKNYGITTTIKDKEVEYDPIEEMIYGSKKTYKYFIDDSSGNGEYTYEEVMQNIGAAIDAQFFIVDTTVCFVSFNSLMALSSSEAIVKSIQPRIEAWQMEDRSLEVDINQYGYYNTVVIKYKNGTLERSFEDLVRVYGRIAKTYKEPELNYEGAQLKAQAYLAAHVRDFGMTVKFTMLYTGKITVASFIKVTNPLTMSESLLYVYGINVHWSAEGETMLCDVDCRYGPENPDNPEIPEYGLGYSGGSGAGAGGSYVYSGNVPANVQEAARMMIGNLTDPTAKAAAIYNWVDQNVVYEKYDAGKYTSEQVLVGKRANCWDTAYLIYNLCTAVGVKCEVYNGMYHFLDGDIGHLWNRIEQNGQMVFADTGRNDQNPIGNHGEGRYIISDSLMEKNY